MPDIFDLNPYFQGWCREISEHTAIFNAEDDGFGSGTFVNACGLDGILTAHHVLKDVFKFDAFGLCLTEDDAPLTLARRDSVECVPFGPAPKDPKSADGPDLAFVIIRETTLLAKIREHKKFYRLDSANLAAFCRKFGDLPWCVAGTYADSVKPREDPQRGRLTRLENFVAVGHFQSRSIKDEFDYIELKMTAGEYGFPYDYSGVSGGGFWLIPFIGNSQVGNPILGGVEFHQSDPENHERILTGHGFDSIYSNVRQTLKNKQQPLARGTGLRPIPCF